MALHRAGRPSKPEQKKRQQLHISLYAEDIERLDRLSDNRSEFIRQCIAKAWEEKVGGEATLSVTVPVSLVQHLRKIIEHMEQHNQASTHRARVERVDE